MQNFTLRRLALLVMTFAACQTAAPAAVVSSDVQRTQAAQAAGWVSGKTSMTELSPAARVHRLGVPVSLLPRQHLERTADASAWDLPTTFDWRDADGKNFVSPVLDQGDCGSCVAFASTATLETQLNIAAGDTTSPFELSPQYIFACGGGGCDWGWNGDDAAKFLTSTGEPDYACLPYTSGANDLDVECKSACADASQRAIKLSGFSKPASNVTAVKQALLKGPVLSTMTVFDDFMSYKSGVYKHVTGEMVGGHAVSIIGWNENDKAWIARNSWGTSWGMNGFFEIAYDDMSGVGYETWAFNVTAPAAYVDITGLRDGSMFSGMQSLILTSHGVTAGTLNWTLTPTTSTLNGGNALTSDSATLDTSKVQDGVYTLQAHAVNATQTVVSQPRQVYVLNGTETGTIAITSHKSGQTVSGDENIQFTVNASPVPLTAVRFTLTDASGTAVIDDTITGNTATKMEISWDTTHKPNGTYTLTLTGIAAGQSTTPTSVKLVVKNKK